MAAPEATTTTRNSPVTIWAVAMLWRDATGTVCALWQGAATDEGEAIATARAVRPDAPVDAGVATVSLEVSLNPYAQPA